MCHLRSVQFGFNFSLFLVICHEVFIFGKHCMRQILFFFCSNPTKKKKKQQNHFFRSMLMKNRISPVVCAKCTHFFLSWDSIISNTNRLPISSSCIQTISFKGIKNWPHYGWLCALFFFFLLSLLLISYLLYIFCRVLYIVRLDFFMFNRCAPLLRALKINGTRIYTIAEA